MNLPQISIRNPVFAWMMMAALILFGWLYLQRMGISQMPDVDFPVVNISLSYDRAAPEIMETDIVDIVEDALTSLAGIKSISSSSKMGRANISVEFELDKNIDVAVREVESALSGVRRRLPKEMDEPVVRKTNSDDQPILWVSLSSATLPLPELMTLVRDRVKGLFTTIEGVGEVELGGLSDPILRVEIVPSTLDQYQLTASDVINTVTAENVELPAGRLLDGEREFNIRTLGEVKSLGELQKITITKRGGALNYQPIALEKVAHVSEGLDEIRRKSRVGQALAVGLGIKKQRGSNSVAVAKRVKEKIRELQGQLPPGVEMGIRFDMTQSIEESIDELNFALILSAILTALVCWLFLGHWSSTLNVVLAIPTSVVGSFIVLSLLGFTLNTFTILALSLAIGIVVDDAIMVLENIVRHREAGKERVQAALIGAREITFAALAATAAVVAIFLPVAFMEGVIGKFFFQFGVTLSVAVLLSLFEALTLTPMRCSQFLSAGHRTTRIGKLVESAFFKSARLYEKILPTLLHYRWSIILMGVVIFAGSLYWATALKREFTPSQDIGRLMLRLQAPIGSSLSYTESKMKEATDILEASPYVEQYFTNIGGSDVNSGMAFITLKPKLERRPQMSQEEIANHLRGKFKTIKGAKIMINDPSMGGGGMGGRRGQPIEFTVRGGDWTQLIAASKELMAAMEKTGLMTDIDTDYRDGMPEVQVIPSRQAAQAHGVSMSDIGQTINVMMGGVTAGTYTKDGHRYDIVVTAPAENRRTPQDILRLKVRNNRGELIPLAKLVEVRESSAMQAISREDRERAITLSANIARGSSQAIALKKVQELAKEVLPSGVHAVFIGSAQTFQDSMKGLVFALLLGVLISYMVLASQFNSFIHPITVLVALPFSLTGALMALALTDQSINIYSMIGILLLMGIVKKNSILLVDFTNQMRQQGHSIHDALKLACPVRLRPILMTSFATITAAVPAAFSLGPGSEMRIPMATAVIGGVVVSTLLTLFVVPCVYSLLSNLEFKK